MDLKLEILLKAEPPGQNKAIRGTDHDPRQYGRYPEQRHSENTFVNWVNVSLMYEVNVCGMQ